MRALFFCIIAIAISFNSFAQCPPSGREKSGQKPLSDKEKALNTAKNQAADVPSGSADYWDINEVITADKHNDRTEFTQGQYVYLEGYLVDFTPEGGESCNCYMADQNKAQYGDVHIYIGLTKNAKKPDCVVVEITPKYKTLNTDYLTYLQQVKGKQVRVFGYLLYDFMHERNSANLCNSCNPPTVWRKTCWEIHPIVAMEDL